MTLLRKCCIKIHDQFSAILGINNVSEILALIDHSTPQNIAEIGGGTGYLANKLITMGHQVTIINPNKTKTQLAKARNPAIHIIKETVAHVPQGNTFDYLIFHNSLHHMSNHLFLFNNCDSLLLNNGHIIIQEFCPDFWQSKMLFSIDLMISEKITPVKPEQLPDVVSLAQVLGDVYPLSKRDYYFMGKKFPSPYTYTQHFNS